MCLHLSFFLASFRAAVFLPPFCHRHALLPLFAVLAGLSLSAVLCLVPSVVAVGRTPAPVPLSLAAVFPIVDAPPAVAAVAVALALAVVACAAVVAVGAAVVTVAAPAAVLPSAMLVANRPQSL